MVKGISKEQVCHEEHQEETPIKLKNRYIKLENAGSIIKDVCWRRNLYDQIDFIIPCKFNFAVAEKNLLLLSLFTNMSKIINLKFKDATSSFG